MSVTDIEVSSKEKMMKVSCKLFLDDIQQELSRKQHSAVDLTKNSSSNTLMLENYFRQHLTLNYAGNTIVLKAIGYEIEEEAVWCYLECPLKKFSNGIQLTNNILCGSLEGQTNIIRFTVDGKNKSHKLVCPANTATIELEK